MTERIPEHRPPAPGVPLVHLEIVTPLGLAHKDDVDEVIVPAARGELGVQPLHRPLLAALAAGSVRWRHGTEWEEAVVGPGFLEVGPDRVSLLAEKFLDQDAIDVAAAQAELAAADQALLVFDGEPGGARQAELGRERAWAAARVDVGSRRRLEI